MYKLVADCFSLVAATRWRLAAVAAAAGLAAGASPAAARSYHVPRGISGNCSTDVTEALRAWIASVPNHSTLVFARRACYRIEGTIQISDRTGLNFEGHGSTFRSFDPPADQRALWRVWQSRVVFRNMTLIGSYAAGGTFDDALQHAHGIDLRGTTADVTDVTVKKVAGDCFYFGLGSDARTRSAGKVTDSRCLRTSRNAVSVTAGDNIVVRRLATGSIGYDVFDVEPNVGPGNWGAQNVTFADNMIGSYNRSAYSIVENAPVRRQRFIDNRVIGRGLKVTIGYLDQLVARAQAITITGNSSTVRQTPAAMNVGEVDGLLVTANRVPMTSGTMAAVTGSCGVRIAGNRFPGGRAQSTITRLRSAPRCSRTSFRRTRRAAGHPRIRLRR